MGKHLVFTVHDKIIKSKVGVQRIADLGFTTFEGAFILVRTMGDPSLMRGQLAHLRRYVELLFELEPSNVAARS